MSTKIIKMNVNTNSALTIQHWFNALVLILTTILWEKNYYYFDVTDEKTEA